MKKLAGYSFIITFTWFGFICAISFMEAPVKFTAPLLTRQVGLDVGRTVFAALNKVEIFFAFLSLILIFIERFNKKIIAAYILIMTILILQTFWLLPSLNVRASMIINGITPPSSNIHLYYIFLELIKAFTLLFLGLMQVNYFRSILIKENENKNMAD
jgi:hypothetical protein